MNEDQIKFLQLLDDTMLKSSLIFFDDDNWHQLSNETVIAIESLVNIIEDAKAALEIEYKKNNNG